MAASSRVAAAEGVDDAQIVSVGVVLFLAADLFFFAAWWFSYFYLRALDNNSAWKAAGVGPPSKGFGLVVLGLVVLAAVCYWVASRLSSRSFVFQLLAPVSLVLGIAACLYQGFGLWHFGFGLTQGAYPSVFAGLTGSWIVEVAFAVGWLATVVVQARAGGDTALRPRAAASFAWILLFLSGVGIINYLLLYLVS